MATKILQNLFKIASQEKAEKMIISHYNTDLSCFMQLPLGEEANFKLAPKFSQDLLANFRKLLKIPPEELSKGQYFKLQDKNYNLNFYLNIISGLSGEKIIMTLVQPTLDKINFKQLGWASDMQTEFKNILKLKTGLIVIASDERQGKSTTLRACLSLLANSDKNIYFLSNNIATEVDRIPQLKNNPENWDRLLKYDTDIIAVEAENDTKILENAILAANTGRLVIVSLKAVNTFEALFKLLSLPLPISLIVDNLKIISAQKLLPLKRVAHQVSKNKRQLIAIFETLTLNLETKNYLSNNYSKINTSNFWRNLAALCQKNGYQAMVVDEKKKKKAGLI